MEKLPHRSADRRGIGCLFANEKHKYRMRSFGLFEGIKSSRKSCVSNLPTTTYGLFIGHYFGLIITYTNVSDLGDWLKKISILSAWYKRFSSLYAWLKETNWRVDCKYVRVFASIAWYLIIPVCTFQVIFIVAVGKVVGTCIFLDLLAAF